MPRRPIHQFCARQFFHKIWIARLQEIDAMLQALPPLGQLSKMQITLRKILIDLFEHEITALTANTVIAEI